MLALLLTVTPWLPGRPQGQEFELRKLNGPLARLVSGDVSEPALSPDGKWAVYLADRDVDERPELYSVPSDGGAPAVKLSAPLGSGRIAEFRITPDSTRVVYRTEDNLDELRSAPLDGSAPAVRLNTPDLARITSFELPASGARLAFLGSEFAGSVPDALHAAPLDGSAPSLQLNPPLPLFGSILSCALTPDGTRVVYAADQELAFVRELYMLPSTGGTPLKLSGPTVASATVLDFVLSPDGARAVFRADRRIDGTYELFTTAVDGSGTPAPLSTPAVAASADYRFAAGGRLLFSDGTTLASVPADGSAPMTSLGDLSSSFRLSPDGTRVVFLSQHAPFDYFLKSSPVDGSAPGLVLVDGPVQDNFQVGRGVVLFAETGLQSVPLDAARAPVRLDLVPASGFISRFGLDHEGAHALYVKGGHLMRVPVHHPEAALELATGLDGDDPFFVAPRTARRRARQAEGGRELASPTVVFLRQQAFVQELFSVPLDGSRTPRVLNLPFFLTEPAGVVDGYLVDGPWLVYRAQEDEAFVDQLFGLRLDQPGPAVELDGPVPPFDLEGSIANPSGRYVYRSGAQLHSVPLDGGAGLQLSSAVPGEGILQVELDAGETRAAFLQTTVASGPRELHVRAVDGSSPALRLSAAGVHVRDFRLDPLGTHAVYRADPVAGSFELFAVPLDGSAPPVKLNGPIPQFHEGVREYVFSPDGQQVVYVADQDADGLRELHAAARNGSGELLITEPALFDALDYPEIQVSSAGLVVYTAEADSADQLELYSVPLAGGVAPVRLNGPLIPEGDVYFSFELSPDGTRVVFTADDLVNHRLELFSAPVDGSAAAVKLSGLTDESSDPDVQFDPHDARVYFRRFGAGGVEHLFQAPLDGSSAAQVLDLCSGPFHLLPGGARVLYTRPGPFSPIDLDLYLASTSGGTPVRVNPPQTPLSGEVGGAALASPGFVFYSNADDSSRMELYQAVLRRHAPR